MKKILLTLCAVVCTVAVASAQLKLKPFEPTVKYRGEISIGGAFSGTAHVDAIVDAKFNVSLSRPFLETVHGVMISDYIFVGAGVGLQYYAGKLGDLQNYYEFAPESLNTLTVPIFVNVKGFLPLNNNIKPFINLGLGGSVVACTDLAIVENTYGHKHAYDVDGGFYCDFGAGVEYKRWSVGIGLQHQRMSLTEGYDSDVEEAPIYFNSFYIKLGVSF